MSDEQFMRMAIEKAKEGLRLGQTPFAATIVKAGEVIACDHNMVWLTTDITAHAEVTAIRRACSKLSTIDLSGCVIYSTTEPCPMCFSACHWARLDRIVYGADIADARAAGFSELTVSNAQLKREGGSPIEIVPGFLREEAVELFRLFAAQPGARKY
ncbi:MAG: tRNA-specific adenosine deaminase [Phycisphaerales bacterium]|nr:tRNA-specific adenosine deaminase [Phycisphaerales bacterium]MDB5304334.1 tRNA-specific adenosine deaminase [Phycisphaerales bacterium]